MPKKVFQFFKEHPDEKHFIYDGKPYDFLNSLLTYINRKHENDVHRIWEIMKLDDGRNLYECFIVNTRVRDTLLNFIEPELKRLESMAGQEMAAQNLFSEPFKEYWKNNIAHLSHGYNYDIDFYPVMREDFLENLRGGMEEDELIIPKDCRAKMLVVSTYVSYNVHLGVLVYRPLQKITLAGNSAIALTATNISALK